MATINGTNNGETKIGTTAADTINGYGGIDKLYGRAGNDTIDGGTGADSIWGEDGNDILRGGTSQQLSTVERDFIYGGNGNDIIYGNAGDDMLYGDAGTDTVKGEIGHDTIKGGTGISYLYGGEGHDQLYYDPTTDNIAKIGQYLSGSILNGDADYDTLNIFNRATYTSGTIQKATKTSVWIENGVGHIRFEKPGAEYASYSDAGTFRGIESIFVTGNGGLNYSGDYSGSYTAQWPTYIVGTTASDTFRSYHGNDIMKGGAGNDTFYAGGGGDQVRSESNDADIIHYNGYAGAVVIEGFNGAGVYGGDRLYINDYYIDDKAAQISEGSGLTVFNLNDGGMIQVVGLGLVEGVDYFIA